MSDYIEPLNLRYIFQNVLAGNPYVFIGLFLIGFSILAGVFKMEGRIYLMLLGLGSLILYTWIGGGLYLIFIFMAIAFFIYHITKLVKN
jgi:hypothetical protein